MKAPRFPRSWWPFGDSEAKAQALLDSFDEFEITHGRRRGAAVMRGARLTDAQIADLITHNWLARRIVRTLPEAAWGSELVFTEPSQLEEWQRINASPNSDDGVFLTAAFYARAFGKSLVLKGFEYGGDLGAPLLEMGSIVFLEAFTPEQFDVQASDVCQDKSNTQRYGLPEFYRIIKGRFAGARIHYTRFVEFVGPTAADAAHMRSEIKGVHCSVLDPVWDVIREYDSSWAAVSKLIRQASIPIFKMKGAIKGISADAENVLDRFDVMAAQMSSSSAVVLDADFNEEYRREAVSFADLPAIIQQLSIKIASAGNIPLGELFGRMMAGLGDSEGGETAKWERQINSYRVRTLAPRIRAITGPSSQVKWSFAPVTPPEPSATLATLKGYWDMGAVTDAEVRTAAERACDLEHVEDWQPQGSIETAGAEVTDPAAAPSTEEQSPSQEAGIVETPGGGSIEVTASGAEGVITANQYALSVGLPLIMKPDGSLDPDGNLSIEAYRAKQKAKVEAEVQAAALAAERAANGNAPPADPNASA